jgi:hypothetical protein
VAGGGPPAGRGSRAEPSPALLGSLGGGLTLDPRTGLIRIGRYPDGEATHGRLWVPGSGLRTQDSAVPTAEKPGAV